MFATHFKFCLFSLLIGLLDGCVQNNDDLNDQNLSELSEETIKAYRELDRLKNQSIGLLGGQDLKKEVAWLAYQNGFDWLRGENFLDKKMLSIQLSKETSLITFDFDFDLNQIQPLPTVYNADFNQKEIADKLKIGLKIRNKGALLRTIIKEESICSTGKVRYSFDLTLGDVKKLNQGWNELTVEINTELVSFFGIKSGVKPIAAKISFNYYVPEIHQTEIYFNKLVLNCEEVSNFLGNNDWNNGAPEAGIAIYNNGNHICTEFTKNSCSHLVPFKLNLFHKGENDSIEIRIVDVDYGFNGNDLIADTLISLKSIASDQFIDLPLKLVESLEMRCNYRGRVN
ncbi:hypothetical protein N8987_02735 [Crocinitomix sp.]|nr:hypothetical protein [Crocinitomix sp.]